LTINSASLIKNNLATLIEKYNITSFIFLSKNSKKEGKTAGEDRIIPKLIEKM
jgi:hypothetical protein